jgi:hypothetical protein
LSGIAYSFGDVSDVSASYPSRDHDVIACDSRKMEANSRETVRMAQLTGRDRTEQKLIDDIASHGWHWIHIPAEGARVGYSFTVGLFQSYGHPELIVVGLPRQVAHDMLACCASAAQAGSPIDLTRPTDALLENGACAFAEVPASAYREYAGYALWYYEKKPFPLYQIVWPSRVGLFPWHPEAPGSFREAQPVIGMSAAF